MIRRLARNAIIAGSIVAAFARALVTPAPRTEASLKSRIVRLIRRKAIEYGLLFGALAVGGFLVAASGIMPIKASSGHWPITAWFLNFSMERSIATHSLTIDAPPLDDPAQVAKGAGHYDIGCRPCHGSPELRHPRIAAAATPHPPYLPPLIGRYKPRELFYVVKHGVKFTGMPAWPAQERDDEVWAMTAFLLRLPKLNADEYRRISGAGDRVDGAAMPALAPRGIVELCSRCHGVGGEGGGHGAFPRLAGQREAYLFNSLLAFATGERESGIMGPIAAGLDRNQMLEAARFYASRPAQHRAHASAGAGEEIARRGIPSQLVPACLDCHGSAATQKNNAYPLLDGQYEKYLVLQLELFHSGKRGGSPYAHLMEEVAPRMTPEQIREVARYFAGRW